MVPPRQVHSEAEGAARQVSVIQVKSGIVYEAIQATDPEADEVVGGWFHEENPETIWLAVDLTIPKEHGLWFVKHPSGGIMLVPAADFASSFEEADPFAAFTAALEAAPTAHVADDVEARKQAQAQIDAYIRERVGSMVSEFEDLLGMAQDQEDSTAQEGVEWAYERFKSVFGVSTDN